MLVLDYSLLYMAFSLARHGGFNPLRGCAGLFSMVCVCVGGVGELRVVHDAHLYLLQFHASSFGASWGEIA
jgi:hypothetical protein